MAWIETISSGIEKLFKKVRPALPAIPPILLLCELKNRPGLSAIALTAAIIQRLPEVGIETGNNVDGSANKITGLVRVMVEEIIKEIKDNGVVTAVIEPGTISTFGTGGNAGGPVSIVSTNTVVSSMLGMMR